MKLTPRAKLEASQDIACAMGGGEIQLDIASTSRFHHVSSWMLSSDNCTWASKFPACVANALVLSISRLL